MSNLYIVATPIGNLQDINLRALSTLEKVDLIACEDTRKATVLINEFFPEKRTEMLNKLFSYYDEIELQKIPQVMNLLLNGKDVALISDAGTPTISDPGFKLVRECIKNNIKVISVPGASSVISALVTSGLPTDKFMFLGFLPQKPGHRLKFLENVKKQLEIQSNTVIFFESPHKLLKSLKDLKTVFGNMEITIVREQTKLVEENIVGNIVELIEKYKKGIKGELVILFNIKET